MRRPVPAVDSLNLLQVLDRYMKARGARQCFKFGPIQEHLQAPGSLCLRPGLQL